MPGTMPPQGALHAAREYAGLGPCVVASWAVARRRRAYLMLIQDDCVVIIGPRGAGTRASRVGAPGAGVGRAPGLE
eukprot:15443595-Alexandrium_andersonii.AAC.1